MPNPTISAEELQTLLSKKEPVFLLDVRQKEEYDEVHIDKSTLIPLGTLENQYKSLPKDKKIIVYCASGKRSAQAAAFLLEKGFKDVASLEGGIVEWLEFRNNEG